MTSHRTCLIVMKMTMMTRRTWRMDSDQDTVASSPFANVPLSPGIQLRLFSKKANR